MELQLTKPIIFFDLETTGVNFQKDRIVEISYIKVHPNGSEEERTYRVNPECPIPPESTAIHHITDEDVAGKPTFKEIAREVARAFTGADIGGFNSNRFDLPLLMEEFIRAGVDFDISKCRLVDVQTIFHKLEQRTLSAAYMFYCGKNLDEAHSANADTRATYEVLKAQLDKYPDKLQNSIEFLSGFSTQRRTADLAGRIVFDERGWEVCNFGKYKGVAVEEVLKKDSGYYGWMMKGDFAENTKQVLTRIYMRLKRNA